MKQQRILQLARKTVSLETVDILEKYLMLAQRGEIVGVAITAMCGSDQIYSITGMAKSYPLISLGAISHLHRIALNLLDVY